MNCCATCGQILAHKPTRCVRCGAIDDNGELEPLGWRYVPIEPMEATLPDGTPITLPRKVLICEDCAWK